MKKSDFILIALVVVIVVIAIFSSKGTEAADAIEYPVTLSGDVGLNEISYTDYQELVESGEAFIVIIERTGCSYCQLYMPIVKEVAEEKKIAITYIDTENLSEEDFEELSSTNAYLKKNQWGTPTTLFMIGEKVVDSISGYVQKEEFESFIDGKVVLGE